MAFTMTHLIISKNISEIFGNKIGSLPQFYLGSIAPDAVHNRANFTSEYKKSSHLITGTEQWGMITDYDGWESNVTAFLNKHKDSENRDFVIGYCAHILGDLYNTIKIWTPFRLKYADEFAKGYGNIHHIENYKIDIELALTYEYSNELWLHLKNSKSIDFLNIVCATEMDKLKDNVLYSWYKDKERQDISSNKIRTYENEIAFIKDATTYISNILACI